MSGRYSYSMLLRRLRSLHCSSTALRFASQAARYKRPGAAVHLSTQFLKHFILFDADLCTMRVPSVPQCVFPTLCIIIARDERSSLHFYYSDSSDFPAPPHASSQRWRLLPTAAAPPPLVAAAVALPLLAAAPLAAAAAGMRRS